MKTPDDLETPTPPATEPAQPPEYTPPGFLEDEPGSWIQRPQPAPPPVPVIDARGGMFPQQPQQPQQPRLAIPEYDSEALLDRNRAVIDEHIRAYFMPVVQALVQMNNQYDEKLKSFEESANRVPRVYVDRAYRDVQNSLREAFTRFSQEPAFQNPKVRERVEKYLKSAREEAYNDALNGDFEGFNSLSSQEFLDTVLYFAMKKAGVSPSPRPVVPQGVSLGVGRTSPGAPKKAREFTAEQIQALEELGIAPEKYAELLDAEDESNG